MEDDREHPTKGTVQIAPTIPREVYDFLRGLAEQTGATVSGIARKWLMDRYRTETFDKEKDEHRAERRRATDRRTLSFTSHHQKKSGGAD